VVIDPLAIVQLAVPVAATDVAAAEASVEAVRSATAGVAITSTAAAIQPSLALIWHPPAGRTDPIPASPVHLPIGLTA
jgi:hypothetical protein